jgi:phage-related protein
MSGFGKTALGVFGGGVLLKGLDLAVDGLQALGGFVLDGVDKLDAYGDSLGRLDAMAAGLGKTATSVDLTRWGVDSGEAAASALAIAKMGKSLGLTDQELATTVPGFQKLAAQLASLGDGDPAAQAELLAKAMGGNAKAAKALGIQLPKGVSGMEAYAAIVAQLGPQLDQATAGQASLSDVGERWDATLANLQLQLAGFLDQLAPVASALLDALVPALQQLVQLVGPALSSAFGTLAETFAGFAEGGAAGYVGELLGTIASVAGKLGGFLVDRVVPVILDLANALGEALAPVLPLVEEAFAAWWPVLDQVFGFVEDVIVPILKTYVVPLLGELLKIAVKLIGALGQGVGGALKTLSGAFQKLLDWAKPVLDVLRNIASFGGDVLRNVGNVIGLSATPGGAPAASARSGVAVVNVYAGVGDPVQIGREVSRVLGAYSSRTGHLVVA